eukprot:Pompholyxophrys_sp_v1_NODE_131_length_1692_cov_2.154551.p1 type:complete len:159 gc:universal NODE_131_length_1692_cov_2.154551:605-129(-)
MVLCGPIPALGSRVPMACKKNLHSTYQFQTVLIDTSIAHLAVGKHIIEQEQLSEETLAFLHHLDLFHLPKNVDDGFQMIDKGQVSLVPSWTAPFLENPPQIMMTTSRIMTPKRTWYSTSYVRAELHNNNVVLFKCNDGTHKFGVVQSLHLKRTRAAFR